MGTLLHFSFRKPHLQNVISLFLQRGANPNSSSLPMPVLFFAVKSADPEAVTALLKQNASTSAKLDGQVSVRVIFWVVTF